MFKTIQVLEKIQKIDLEILAVEEEEKRYAAGIEGLKSEIESGKGEIETAAAEIEALRARIREIDDKIAQSNAKVEKDEKRLNDIKNTKEMNALTKEISGANKAKRQCEQDKAALNEKVDEKTKALNEKEEAFGAKTSELERLVKEAEERGPGWQQAIEKGTEARDAIKAGIRPDVLRRYEMIRAKKGGQGIALIKNETCQGCFIHLPPQVSIILKRGTDELQFCPHCHRILYIETTDPAEAV